MTWQRNPVRLRATDASTPRRPSRGILARLLPPLAGVVISLLAYAAQNVWQIFHIQDVTDTIRGFDPAGLAFAVFLIGVVEGTVILCFYLPGTAILILLLLGLQPPWAETLVLLAWMMAGTLAGFGMSVLLGQGLKRRLPGLVGRGAYRRMRRWLARAGTFVFAAAAFHPNPLALAFSIAGYLRARDLWKYGLVAVLGQTGWWAFYASSAGLLSRQTVVTGNNFQLFLAGLFFVWFAYEILRGRQAAAPSEAEAPQAGSPDRTRRQA